MTLPSEYLLLRQPGRLCEVVFIKGGTEHVMFSGKRWPARHYLKALRNGIGYESVPVYVRKESGNIVLNENRDAL